MLWYLVEQTLTQQWAAWQIWLVFGVSDWAVRLASKQTKRLDLCLVSKTRLSDCKLSSLTDLTGLSSLTDLSGIHCFRLVRKQPERYDWYSVSQTGRSDWQVSSLTDLTALQRFILGCQTGKWAAWQIWLVFSFSDWAYRPDKWAAWHIWLVFHVSECAVRPASEQLDISYCLIFVSD